ncbi:MAG: ABC transporter ATP-binding protein [Micropruina sp.]
MPKSRRSVSRGPNGWVVLWRLASQYRWRMVLLGVVSFAGAMLEAAFLVVVTATVLALAAGRETIGPILGVSMPVTVALVLSGLSVAARLGLSLATVTISTTLGAFVRTEQRRRLAHAYLRSSWSVQQAEAAGGLQELLTSFVGRINTAMNALTQAITASLSLVAFMAAGVAVDPVATVVVLAALGILGAVLTPIRTLVRKQAAISAQADLALANTVAELSALGQEMQTFGVERQFERQVDLVIDRATQTLRRLLNLHGSLSPLYTFLAYAAVVGGVSALRVFGVSSLAATGSLMLLMLRSLTYGQQLMAVSGTLASSLPSLERVDETVAHYASNAAPRGEATPLAATPIQLDGVSYAYSNDRPALQGLDFSIEEGETIGVIGPSGAGKSTLAQLLLGLREPTAGAVRVHGVDLRHVDRRWFTSQVAFVPQDPLLITGTAAENIRFFREGIDQDELVRACREANVLDDVAGLPHGFDTHLGERGTQLSGGQRQRLSIARALVGKPSVLILDEPTSALDGKSEALIRDTLAQSHGLVTTIIIAHRMSTLDLCDRILVLEHGGATAMGTPGELLATSAFYREALSIAGGA